MSTLKNKVVLITGASTHTGHATAVAFAKHGARLMLDNCSEATIQTVRREGLTRSASIAVRSENITAEEKATRLVRATIDTFGQLDIAINNVGTEILNPNEWIKEDNYARVFDTNIRSVCWAIQAEIIAMRQRGGGSIINVISSAGENNLLQNSITTANRYAVEGLSRALGLLLGNEGIRVNVVAPGPQEVLPARVLANRGTGAPVWSKVAQTVIWLASDESSLVNGVSFPVGAT